IELQKLKQFRAITPEQITNFIFLTQKIAKIPVRIIILQDGDDTESFGWQLRNMFNRAGFNPPSDAGIWGIDRQSVVMARKTPERRPDSVDVYFIGASTN